MSSLEEEQEDKAKAQEASVMKIRATLMKFEFVSPVRPRRTPQTPLIQRKVESDSESEFEPDSDDDITLPSLLARSGRKSSRKRKSPTGAEGVRARRKKIKRGFAPAETYAHLHLLQDYLEEGLDIMFCGINPGRKSAEVGHYFTSPNHFWRCLHESGLTDRRLEPSEDFTLTERYNLGLTNLVDRPTAEQAELSKEDMINGVPSLLSKIVRFRPRIVCFVGKGIWEVFHRQVNKSIAFCTQEQLPKPCTIRSRYFSTPPAKQEGTRQGGAAISSAGTPTGKDTKSKRESTPFLTRSPYFSTPPAEEERVRQGDPAESSVTATRKGTKGKRKRKATTKLLFSWGLQPCKVVHSIQTLSENLPCETLFFVMPSTSGRVVSHQLPDKVKIFANLRERLLELKQRGIDTTQMAAIPAALVGLQV